MRERANQRTWQGHIATLNYIYLGLILTLEHGHEQEKCLASSN
jgi:hypothetical protein